MGCNCGKKKKMPTNKSTGVMGGYKFLTNKQMKARLEVFKRTNCKECDDRYKCNLEMYNKCDKV